MKRILKNHQRVNLETIFRGRTIYFKSKASKAFNMDDEEEKAEYHHWIKIYSFISDITERM